MPAPAPVPATITQAWTLADGGMHFVVTAQEPQGPVRYEVALTAAQVKGNAPANIQHLVAIAVGTQRMANAAKSDPASVHVGASLTV